jgi:Kef-type K+ transport system membrane component KefB
MRRAFVVLVLLAMMVGLRTLKAETQGGGDPLTLAAIGFVVLAAFAVAELGARLQLPKVTGYIVSGVVLGPFAIKVLSGDVVGEMKMFSTLALGLIATSAGLELDLKGLRALAKTLSVTIAIKIVSGLALVGGTVFGLQMAFGVLDAQGSAAAMAIAIVIAALSLGTSPAIALAILSETKAKGRLADLVLGAAVVKDVVVVVVLLAVAIAAAKALIGGGGISPTVLVDVGKELGASVLAGAILGGLLIAYLRYVKAEMLLFVAAMVLVVAEVSAALHLELLLVFIVAGMVVRNFSSHAHDLLHPLETVSLPVFIVFFTNAGASVNLTETVAVLPFALAVCAARAVGYVVAGRLGGRVGGEPELVRKLAWLGYLPQAGVTLGLLGVAATQLPELAGPVTTLGMAVVAVNLLVGPVTLRVALRAAGEIPDEADAAADGATAADAPADTPTGAPWEAVEAAGLRDVVREVVEAGEADARRLVSETVVPWIDERVRRLVEPLSPTQTRDEALSEIGQALERMPPDDAPQRVDDALRSMAALSDTLEGLPSRVEVPLEDRFQRVMPEDAWWAGVRKRWAWAVDLVRLRRNARVRVVPVRMLARTLLEPALGRALEEGVNAWYRVEVEMLEELRRCALQTRTVDEAAAAIIEHGERFVANLEVDLASANVRRAQTFALELDRLGSPVFPASRVRYSKVEPELVRWRARMATDAEGWGLRRSAAIRLVHVTNEVALIEERLGGQLREQVLAAGEEAFSTIREEVAAQGRRLAGAVERTRGFPALDEESLGRLEMELGALIPRPVHKKLRTIGARLRRATSSGTVANIFRDATVEQAGREAIVPTIAVLVEARRPANVEVVMLDVGETIQGNLSAELAPRVEETLGELWTAFAAAREAMGNCESAAEFVLTSATREGLEEMPTSAELATQLEQAGDVLAPAGEPSWEQWEALQARLMESLGGIDEHLVEAIAASAGRSSARSRTVDRKSRLWATLRARFERVRAPVAEALTRLVRRARGEAAHGLGRHYRLRAGTERADAADVREFVAELVNAGNNDLPPVYRALFSADPVRDPRLFVANRDALQEVVRAERGWQQDPSVGNGVLVIGRSGTGKTSLVHVARLKLAARRVVSVPLRDRVDDGGLRDQIARELGCEVDGIERALQRSRSAIVVDDLQTWISLGPRGVAELDTLLNLIAATQATCFWLMALSSDALEALESLLPIRPAFAQVVRLRNVSATELGAVVESRQALSGLSVSFPVGLRAQLLDRLLRRSPRESYLHGLVSVSGGNLRRSLRAWGRHARLGGERQVELSPVGVDLGLPYLRQLTAAQLATLATLLQFGKRRAAELCEVLAIRPEHAARELRFLVASGLVDEEGEWVEVATIVRDDVAGALVEFGALAGGGR